MDKTLFPVKRINGSIRLPGDKSISHRALMLGAIADGETVVENLSNGEDVRSTADCLQKLGIRIEQEGAKTVINGKGLHGLQESEEALDVGNSGTTIRLLSGILAGQQFTSTLTGDSSIAGRPMSRIIKPLRLMGAEVNARDDNFTPLTITGGHLNSIRYRMPVASAQLKSCLLFAGLYADGTTEVIEKQYSRDHTERMLQTFGVQVARHELSVQLTGPARLTGQTIYVPGDLSSAAFFIAAAILIEGSELVIYNVGVNPTRKAFLSLLSDMGADITIMNVSTLNNEIIADLVVKSSKLQSTRISGALIPQLIDEIPIIAVLATQAEGKTIIQDAGELRLKESDRLATVAANLQILGAEVVESDDGLSITGPQKLKSASIDSYGDHRIAMAFTIAALLTDSPTTIKNAESASISFPGFYAKLLELSYR
jgi:3-phosphoshikimate 1-carboxyvinyltransferase